jgi:hypothetical protein
MIPAFNDYECLPEGIYDCTMDEAAERFGVFRAAIVVRNSGRNLLSLCGN